MTKNKTLLSILTLFFLLEIKPLQADNYWWNFLTSSTTLPWSLCIGFWSVVTIAGKWLPSIEDVEQTKEENINNAAEHSVNVIDVVTQSCQVITENTVQSDEKVLIDSIATRLTHYTIKKYADESLRRIQKNQQQNHNYLKSIFKVGFEEIRLENTAHLIKTKATIDSGLENIELTVQNRLEKGKEKITKLEQETIETQENIIETLRSMKKTHKKDHVETLERITYLQEEIVPIKKTLSNDIDIIQRLQGKAKKFEILKEKSQGVTALIEKIQKKQREFDEQELREQQYEQQNKTMLLDMTKKGKNVTSKLEGNYLRAQLGYKT